MSGTKKLFLFYIFLFPVFIKAQIFTEKKYPKGYFEWPVKATRALAANFGELRPNHYHMGLDCKTDKRENIPVIAAADGYIAKVKIEPSGFGRCIYINHPNGLTTLYAHLNEFYPALDKYVEEQQYALESWKIFIDVPANLLPVKKGQFIANSGNTGGSQGPHLHFEIRDTRSDKVLNPLLFGFPITDRIAPDIIRLALYDRNKSTYEQSPAFIQIKKLNGKYITIPSTLSVPFNKVSFAITAYDRYTGSTNQNGIYEADLFDNNQPVIGFQLDSISYGETRYLNAHIDYKMRNSGGPFVQHLSRLPGYMNGIYKEVKGDGVIDLSDNELHQIRIEVKDTEGNTSLMEFGVKSNGQNNLSNVVPGASVFKPGYLNVFENSQLKLYLPENYLYDSFNFSTKEIQPDKGFVAYQIMNGNIPVHGLFPISIRNNNPAYRDNIVMHRWWNNKDDYAATEKQADWFKASFKAFGNVELIEDNIPPVISPIGFRDGMNMAKLNRIVFVIKDNTEELKNFRALLDGKWLRFSNDKGKTFIYNFDKHCPAGEHVLKISVEDLAGNVAERVYRFVR